MDICYDCLKPTVKKQGEITFTKPGYGSYKVRGVIYYACDDCGVKIIPPEEAERIEIEGIKLHMLKVLKNCSQPIKALDLKEEVRSSVESMEKSAIALIKEKKITVDYTNPEEPTLSIIREEEKKLTFWEILKSFFIRG